MDTYVEQIIAIKKTGKNYLIYAAIILLAVIITIVGYIFLTPLFVAIGALAAFGAYRLCSLFNIEYEYIITNSTMDIDKSIRIVLKQHLEITPAGQKLFVPEGKKTHIAKTELQNFIALHRKDICDEGSNRNLTFHGLRHTCAAEWYKKFIAEGKTDSEAKRMVSKLLGHEREDVTRIYLAGLE